MRVLIRSQSYKHESPKDKQFVHQISCNSMRWLPQYENLKSAQRIMVKDQNIEENNLL